MIEKSRLFDANWYRKSTHIKPGENAVKHFLRHGDSFSPGPDFDSVWYLRKYPDVAAAGINPLVHYLRYGQSEGRLPKQIYAQLWEQYLWAGMQAIMVPRLHSMLTENDVPAEESRYAAWALARWYTWQNKWQSVYELLWRYQDLDAPFPAHLGPVLLAIESARHSGNLVAAEELLSRWVARKPDNADICLAKANLCVDDGSVEESLDWINRPFIKAHLQPVSLIKENSGLSLDNLFVEKIVRPANSAGPNVTVIVPAYNAESTIATALYSLYAQSWRHLEILVVDDASNDNTWDELQNIVLECPSDITIRLFRQPFNQGAYAARNVALKEATGELITCHDSDDWSHPQKIAVQVEAMLDNPQVLASVSHWVRVTSDLHFHRWRIEDGLIERNVSSLMFRRCVFDELGYWDRVTIAADTEYYYRIFSAYGDTAVTEVLPGIALTFGRAVPGSLSQHSATHEVTQFAGIRKDYMDAAHRWHRQADGKAALYLPAKPGSRPFYAPREICRDLCAMKAPDPMDRLQDSGLVEPLWYCYRYTDLLEIFIEPLQHYWAYGAAEGRDPGPSFSSSGYTSRYEISRSFNPLLHYLLEGKDKGYSPIPIFEGERTSRAQTATVLLCGHLAGQQIYGAERCLLDLLHGLDELGLNVVVTLPGVGDPSYLSALRKCSTAVAVLPYGWWMEGRPDCDETIANFMKLFATFAVDQVYINTLVLHEPALAAKKAGLPVTVHVHELPTDPDLCRTLNSDAEGVVHHLLSLADRLVANSGLVASYLEEMQSHIMGSELLSRRQNIHVVPNTVPMDRLLRLAPSPFVSGTKKHLTVGMVSSNQPKKGLDDFVVMAARLAQQAPTVRCVIYGPRNHYIEDLMSGEGGVAVPTNLSFGGYVKEPEEALEKLDVVLNLSHCQESFGRTILEAMAAGRAVICYDWGALHELVVSGETGILTPFGEPERVAAIVQELAESSKTVSYMGEEGRKRAAQVYGYRNFMQSLKQVSDLFENTMVNQ